MGKCPDCGAQMKPLAYSEFCPNDCDRKVQGEIDPEKTPKLIFWDGPIEGPPEPEIPFITDEELDRMFDDIMQDGTD